MILLGLTGGVGMGKSTAACFFQELGLPVVDTDQLARELTLPGQPALLEIAREFGPAYLTPEGALNRAAMAQKVFADAAARQKLEAILHPRIRAAWQAEAARWRAAGVPVGVVVIPLLYETGAEREVDRVACVACMPRTQAARLAARGWPEEHCRQRIAAQWPVEEKIKRADYVIWTEGSLAAHRAQIERVVQNVKKMGVPLPPAGA
ncbi:dephospho-CoA kinase [Fontisphaera persica]|uniref:dephospho-CoA kinase n=1 Tax=Fontisphaera persica TaxID=2974023 RepID=UPI0024BF9F85|nr:dephospho-CoA kinase [Fontisphaera persica]WCJ58712.1 dephospho-CoA kinase [Fontisphaera persica]